MVKTASGATAGAVRKAKTKRGKRALEKRAPKLVEDDKNTIFVSGGHTSNICTTVLKELFSLKKQNSLLMTRPHPFHPFDDETTVERFASKYDCSLFAFVSHSKKRPHNIILGRIYDSQVLDMFEFGIENFISVREFKSVTPVAAGTKPVLLFEGELFQTDAIYGRMQNVLLDFFQGNKIENLRLKGIEHAIAITALSEGRITVRSYRILQSPSGQTEPRVELIDAGPMMDLVPRRNRMAADDLFRLALKQPKQTKVKKVKNVSRDVFGTEMGRIHVGRQDLSRLQTRKVKGLRDVEGRKKRTRVESENDAEVVNE